MTVFDAPPSSSFEEEKNTDADAKVRIAVVGVGGGGCNTVHRLTRMGITSADTIAMNTDKLHLDIINSKKKILLGPNITKGLGAGGFPEIGQRCAEMSKDEIAKALEGYNLVFVTAGMGGGTGTGGAPVVAKLAKDAGAVVIGIVTYPFKLERARVKKAVWGINELTKYCDTVIVIDNNRLVEYAPNLPMNKAFELADMITAKAVKGISDTIMYPSLINIDFADVRSVMENGGVAVISIGRASGPDKIDRVIENTLKHPLLDVDFTGAKGALIHIGGNAKISLGESIKIGEELTKVFDPKANVKLGARISEEYGDEIEVILIATGVKSSLIPSSYESEETSETSSENGKVDVNNDEFIEDIAFI